MSKRVDKKVQGKVKILKWTCCAFPHDAGKFGEGVAPNDDDTFSKFG
jgi:hypothetical protein